MIYVMGERMYWNYIIFDGMTHEELIAYLNRTRGLRGEITHLEIAKHA